MRSLFIVACVLGALAFTSTAKADVPPPDGEKFIDYAFTVRGLAASPDRVVFAYPCGSSSGAPLAEHRVLQDGKAEAVGRRGGACRLYTIPKADYDAWEKTYERTYASVDPALEQLVQKSRLCDGAPTPSFVTTSDDVRTTIEESLEVKSLTDSSCEIASLNKPSPPRANENPSDRSTTGGDNGSASSATDDGGCSVGGSAKHAGPWLLALGVPLFVFLGARRRKNEKKK